MTKRPLEFLIVEDDPLASRLIASQLEDLGHQIVGQAHNGPNAVELTADLLPDVVLMDLQMPDPETGQDDPRAGIKAALKIQDRCPTPVVVLTAYDVSDMIREATLAGIGAYLLKPPNAREIERAATIATARFSDLQALRELNMRLQEEVGQRERAEEKLVEYAHRLEQMVDEKLRQLEQERAKAIQLDKMAALGEIATGIAHELRQPLTAIQFEADYLRMTGVQAQMEHAGGLDPLLDGAELEEIGDHLEGDVGRCQRLIDHLQKFGRISQDAPILLSINRSIEDSFILIGTQLRSHSVDVHLDLASELPLILADPYRLEQVFLNLISNAEHAMAQRVAEEPGVEKVLEITTAAAGDEVVVTVRDNGSGMSEDVRSRIFDPFFTTKPRGEGTGLGLSISYGIVADYDGQIECESVEGQGTTFTLHFPVADIEEAG